MRTAQEVSDELNISRSDVYNLLRKKRFSPLVQKKGGQIVVSNKLFDLLKEEIENKKSFDKIQENKNITKISISPTETKENTPIEINLAEDLKNKSIELLEKQIEFKDNQITILNNVISNNLQRINELELRQKEHRNLSEELERLKATINDLTKRKNKRKILGFF